MKEEVKKQIAFYTKRLNTMKENRTKLYDKLSSEEQTSFDERIRDNAEFIRVLKQIGGIK